MSHTPTEEQALIIAAARDTTDNLIVSALAGAAKTSTLVMLAEAIPETKILCLAFNKKIAVEMTDRLPKNCTALTLNSLGHRVWAECLGKRIILDKDKNYNNLTTLVKGLKGKEQEEGYSIFADTLKLIAMGKAFGYIPTGHYPNAKGLMGDVEFFAVMEEEPSALQESLIREATLMSLKQAWEGKIDFDDQILMPTVFPSMFPSYPLIMIDEAQDLSALNHATLQKLVGKKRVIAVGDRNQAIYGFRGADANSMDLLQKQFEMKPYILSISFRCPRKVVEAARWRAPHMRYPDWAIEGEVKQVFKWDETAIPDTAAIICRNNAPLFTMAIKLLKNGRYPNIIGNDIGKYLLKVMRKFSKNNSTPQPIVMVCIDDWVEQKLKKTRAAGKVHDQAACLRIFARQGNDLGDAIAYAEYIFASQGPTLLMTGHKSKGLEFDTVFFLDEGLIKLEKEQERNLKYVIQTRAKKALFYVSSDNFLDYSEA